MGVAVFPAGWSASEVRAVCGPTARQYHMGECEVRWAFVLAIIGVLDAAVLAALAFVLATRHVKLQPEPEPLYGGSVYKGTMPSTVQGSTMHGTLPGSMQGTMQRTMPGPMQGGTMQRQVLRQPLQSQSLQQSPQSPLQPSQQPPLPLPPPPHHQQHRRSAASPPPPPHHHHSAPRLLLPGSAPANAPLPGIPLLLLLLHCLPV